MTDDMRAIREPSPPDAAAGAKRVRGAFVA